MAKTTANISIDAETKRQAQELFAELGMDLSTAVTIFFRQAIWEHAMPFDITRNFSNDGSLKAMDSANLVHDNEEEILDECDRRAESCTKKYSHEEMYEKLRRSLHGE